MSSNHVVKFKISDVLLFIYISSLFKLYGNMRPIVEIGSIGLLTIIEIKHKGFVVKLNYYIIWGVVLSSLCLLSALYGKDLLGSLYGTRGVVECFLVGTVVISIIDSENDIYKCMKFAIFGACFLFLKVFVTVSWSNLINRRFPADINANSFGLEMSFCLLILIILVKQSMLKWWKIPGILLLMGILLSGSKKAIIVAVLGIALMLMLFQDHWLKKVIYLFLGITFIGGVYWLTQNNTFIYKVIGYRLYGLVSMLEGTGIGDASSRERAYLIGIAFRYWKYQPFWGYGINSFGRVIGYSAYGSQNVYSHCNYTELLFGLGLVGTAWYYGLFLYLIPKVGKLMHKTPLSKLFMTFLLLILFIDVGMVSYGDEFIQFILVITTGFCTLHSDNKSKQTDIDNTSIVVCE